MGIKWDAALWSAKVYVHYGFTLYYVVPMIREEWKIFRGLRKKL